MNAPEPERAPKAPATALIITKASAAKSQLETAITLWFNDGDPVSIHTLAVAAQDCYRAIGANAAADSAFQKWAASNSKGFQKKLRDAQNFFKHGPREFKGKIHLAKRHAEVLMFDAVLSHNLVFGEFPPLMFLYGLRMAIENPALAAPGVAGFVHKSINVYEMGHVPRREFLEKLLPALEEAFRKKSLSSFRRPSGT